MQKQLDSTVALVTGASSGIGAATARKLADLGAAVVAVARRKDRLDQLVGEIEKAGGTALPIEADITDRSAAAAAVQQAVDRFGIRGRSTERSRRVQPARIEGGQRSDAPCTSRALPAKLATGSYFSSPSSIDWGDS